jgi:hypothetical protein
MVVPIVAAGSAAKGTGIASKALTGDIYTRKWITTQTKGKGKKKRVVVTEHDVHVNPVAVAIAAGVTALTIGGAAWILQMRAKPVMIDKTESVGAAITTPAKGPWVENIYLGPGGMMNAGRYKRIEHPAQLAIWTVKRSGISFTGATAAEAVAKAYPGKTWASIEQPNALHPFSVVFSNTVKKKRVSIESRRGFLGGGEGTDAGDPVGPGSPLNILLGPLGLVFKPFK